LLLCWKIACCYPAPGQFNFLVLPWTCVAKTGSNFFLNSANFCKSPDVTDLLAWFQAQSKCFLVISGTASPIGILAFGSNANAAFFLASDSIHSLTAALAAYWANSARSAPENPSVTWDKKSTSTSLAIGDFLNVAFKILVLDGLSGKGI